MASAPFTPAPKTCPECGSALPDTKSRGKKRVFCSDGCKTVHNNRMAARGKALAKVAMGWRQQRGAGDLGKFLFGEMTTMLDQWNSEDYQSGRMRADHYAALVCDWSPTQPPITYRDRMDWQSSKARSQPTSKKETAE